MGRHALVPRPPRNSVFPLCCWLLSARFLKGRVFLVEIISTITEKIRAINDRFISPGLKYWVLRVFNPINVITEKLIR